MCKGIIFNKVYRSYKLHIFNRFISFLLESHIVNEIDMAILKVSGKKAKFHLKRNCHQSIDVISI